MKAPLTAIEYKPYRGECEPVIGDTIAKLVFHPAHLEIKCYYKFKELRDNTYPEPVDNFVKCHLLLKREGLEVCRSVRVHPFDTGSEECPIIEIWSKNGLTFNVVARHEDTELVFKALKTFILSP